MHVITVNGYMVSKIRLDFVAKESSGNCLKFRGITKENPFAVFKITFIVKA